eukprot:TRINITY_DN19976_c0_g1_i1.p2 TRINITY_DN19976_c0_g1~~TRINITY_DN19976_c0_g1_i1.p2  ORF type:complete len:118 (+),score=19.69 TRINITY_DN19976_c0_g1_i1:2-355(+)
MINMTMSSMQRMKNLPAGSTLSGSVANFPMPGSVDPTPGKAETVKTSNAPAQPVTTPSNPGTMPYGANPYAGMFMNPFMPYNGMMPTNQTQSQPNPAQPQNPYGNYNPMLYLSLIHI